MRYCKLTVLRCLITIATLLIVGPAWGDWNPGDPYKYLQPPDLTDNGMDVNATWLSDASGGQAIYPFQKTLADDFLCVNRGPITDIHLWGSWLNDNANLETRFRLSIYDDIPAGPGGLEYSRPGPLLWEKYFAPIQYVAREYANASEQFYDPNTNAIIGTDTIVWQYNFLIDPAEAFIQQGTAANPKVYWLGVEAIVPWDSLDPDRQEIFGWKTSDQHWNDDAVFGDSADPSLYPDIWQELRYPDDHPLQGQSIDLSFVITVPEPSSIMLIVCAVLGGTLLVRRQRQLARN